MEKSIQEQVADLKQKQYELLHGTTINMGSTLKEHDELQKQIDLLEAQIPPDEPFCGITQVRG